MYLALYRKWRPRTFDDVVGQEHITQTLKNQVRSSQTAHAYLFTGSRGTGKTTCSKILAMAVNCLNPQDGNPCLECVNCKGIEDGSLLDVMEIDAASNNGVADVRLLREEANYTPTQGKFRVYIIDETHMLSDAAFNALLKTMEEPPAHVMFILATTEVHKVPATILSRCQRFDFNRIQTDVIAARLQNIAGQEAFTLNDAGAQLIARLADGGMRDALSVLDQCTAYSSEVTEQVVAEAAGLVLRDYLFDLVGHVQARDAVAALTQIDLLHNNSKDLQRLMGELLTHYRNLMIAKTVREPGDLISCMPEELLRLQQQASELPLAEILQAMTVLQTTIDRIARDHNQRICVEMAMIRLCSPQEAEGTGALLARIEKLEKMLQNGVMAASAVPAPATPTVGAHGTQSPAKMTTEQAPERNHIPAGADVAASKAEVPNVAISAAEAAEESISPGAPGAFDRWPEVLSEMKEADPMMFGVLAGSLAYVSGTNLFIDSPNGLFAQMIRRENLGKKLLDILEQKTGTRFKLRIKAAPKAAEVSASSPLGELTETAKELGIEVKSI